MLPHPINYYYPPSEMPLYWVHCWAIYAFVNFLAFAMIWPIKKKSFPQEPRLISRYRRVYWSVIFLQNLPWLLMGVGILFGGVGSIINFGVFWQPNIVVSAWWITLMALAAAGVLWLNYGGAEELAKCPGIPLVPVGDVQKIKLYTVPAILMFPLFFTLWQNTKVLIIWVVRHPVWKIPALIGIVGCLFGFVALFVFIALQCSEWGAWAKYYRAKKTFKGKKISLLTSKIYTSSGGAMFFGFDTKALHLSFGFMNRPGHPPLLIPWGDIKSSAVRSGSFKGFRLVFKKVPLAPLLINFKTAIKLRKESNNPKLARVFKGIVP